MRYLSDDWFRGFAASLSAATDRRDDGDEATPRITLGYVIEEVPGDSGVDVEDDGSVRYSLSIHDGAITLHRPPLDAPHVEFRQRYDTALAVATGARGSADAVVAGDIVVTGDPRVLTPVAALLAAVDSPTPS